MHLLCRRRAFLGVLLLALLNIPNAFSQGNLTPPGAPAPTMKSLDQIDPGTPISSLPYSITAPGRYYLTTNLFCPTCTNSPSPGIAVLVSDVTIDLKGFTLAGPATGDSDGILAYSPTANLHVENGAARNWGGNGVNTFAAPGSELRNLHLLYNGRCGLLTGPANIVRDCIAYGNAAGVIQSAGIQLGAGNVVKDSVSSSNTYAGFEADGGGVVFTGCTAVGDNIGFFLFDEETITGCSALGNRAEGIEVVSRSRVLNNLCVGNAFAGAGDGILVTGNGNVIDGNTAISNNISAAPLKGGITSIGTAHNVFIRNTASANGQANYNITGTNSIGEIITINNGTGNYTITNLNPWANFIY